MENQVLTSVTYDKFLNDIKEVVKELVPITATQTNNEKSENELLTRKETTKLLNISISTLNNYIKKGILKTYNIQGTIRLKKKEVLASFK